MRILSVLVGIVTLISFASPAAALRLTSEYSQGKIFWRVFNPDDGVRLVGVAEGTLSKGGSIEYIHPRGSHQVEIREGNRFGRILAGGDGAILSNSAELIFSSKGKLQLAQRQTVTVTGEIEVQYSLSSKVEREKFTNKLYLYGSRENPRVTMDSFRIVRDATTLVAPGFGTFHTETGEFSIPGKASVSFGPLTAETAVQLSTGSASSGSKYTGTGTRFDPQTRTLVLVGAGSTSGVEFFVKVTAKLSTPVIVAPPKRPVNDRPEQRERPQKVR